LILQRVMNGKVNFVYFFILRRFNLFFFILKGRKTFNSQSLHKILGNKIYNPFQKVIFFGKFEIYFLF
jgi:hypothetical protein